MIIDVETGIFLNFKKENIWGIEDGDGNRRCGDRKGKGRTRCNIVGAASRIRGDTTRGEGPAMKVAGVAVGDET